MSSSIRHYLKELRVQQHISQKDLADAIGLSLRAFSDWETGKSDELKGSLLVRAVIHLQASWEDISKLVIENIDSSLAEELATKRFYIISGRNNLDRDKEFESLINELWENPKLKNAFLVFWAGWKSREIS